MDIAPLTAGALARAREWFRESALVYPWTLAEDSYAVWISEVMLQQTVVSAAVAPFNLWMARWPDLRSLAAASEGEVLRAWEGLGYASRAKNLHHTAQILVSKGEGCLPDTEEGLRALPGIGDYTAAAILSFAYHRPALTLDANLKRIFLRLGADPEWTPQTEARWRTRWAELVDGPVSRESNLAVMQLGQQVCKAKNPRCPGCPLAEVCLARERNLTDRIPEVRIRQVEQKSTTVVFWYRTDGFWWLARPEKGRFSNLWLAPPVENSPPGARALTPRVHTYTKYRDCLSPWLALWTNASEPELPPGWTGRWASVSDVRDSGMVSVYRRILDEALEITKLG